MRWLFIAVLVILVGCVLSIIWLNDAGLGRIEVTQPQPQNPLAPPPGTPSLQALTAMMKNRGKRNSTRPSAIGG